MRRFFAIFLFASFLLPALLPLLALEQGDDANLPLCCRRAGAHHCGMRVIERAGRTARWESPHERCPFYPSFVATGHTEPLAAPPQSRTLHAAWKAVLLGPVQAEANRRVARDRSRQMRGPPAASFSLI